MSETNKKAQVAPPKTTYDQALEALEAGDYPRARKLIIRLLKRDPNNVTYWLWLSVAAETAKEREHSLRQVLKLDPQHPTAQRGLRYFAAKDVTPGEPVRLDRRAQWQAEVLAPWTPRQARPAWQRRGLALLLGVVTVLLLALGYQGWSYWRSRPTPLPTLGFITVVATTPAVTTPTATLPPSPTPRGTPQPLGQVLGVTHTPTPLYVNTPHPYEAYHRALDAMGRGDWAAAAAYFEQLLDQEPAPDLAYYLAEAYYHLARYADARRALRQALDMDPNFGPAHRLWAQVLMAEWRTREQSPTAADFAVVEQHLRAALKLAGDDPLTYQAALDYWLGWREDVDQAERLLARAREATGDLPRWDYYEAWLAYLRGDTEAAWEAIERALERDPTMLEAYALAARIALARGDVEAAREAAEVYYRYRPEDPDAILLYAQVQIAHPEGDPEAALAALDALADHASPLILRQRVALLGEAYLRLNQPEKALEYLEQADRWDPSFANAMRRGHAHRALGDYGAALVAYREAYERAQTERERYTALYWRAKMAEALGLTTTAQRDWRALLDAPPDLVPWEWRAEAAAALGLPTPTPPASVTPSPTPTASP
ncbi:MAG: tetratricopeptide repeat protein [Chloroflexi bacterium]|nr:tetratricopeptide repeat protein [Chloroflexota bacterium]